MLTLIVIIFCFWLFWKLFRIWAIHKIQQRARSMYEQSAGASQASDPRSADRQRKAGWRHAVRKKKISREEGEYVEWEEVRITDSDSGHRQTTIQDETYTAIDRQIVDAEWEDIK